MATPSVKSTYSLDLETASTLERLAEVWQMSKSGVIRRLAAQAATVLAEKPARKPSTSKVRPVSAEAAKRVEALRALQRETREQGADFSEWKRSIQAARR